MSDGDQPEESHIHHISVPLPPPEMLAEMREAHDRLHLRQVDRRNAMFDFLDGLSVDHLMVLRTMFNPDRPKRAFAMNQYYDGLVVQVLRHKHGVDPDRPYDDPRLTDAGAEPDA